MPACLSRTPARARPIERLHDAGGRIAAIAWRRWFLDRQAEFWLGELGGLARSCGLGGLGLGSTWSSTERRARVVEVIDETPDARTLVLAPGRWWPGHRAGQYVPVELEIDGVRVRRCYSISSGSSPPGARRIAITVRRVAGGRVSPALCQLRRGAVVGLGLPAGDFVLDAAVPPKLLLVGGGSGITPIMAIVRDLAARGAGVTGAPDVVVIHGTRSRRDAIFGHELASLATRFSWLTLHARHDDDGAGRLGAPGRLDAARLCALVPDLADREIFVCGPPGLMDLVTRAASDAGVLDRVHHERFVAAAPRAISGGGDPAAVTVALVRAGTRVIAAGPGPLLAQLERAGQRPPHGCRMGICQSCRCRKLHGTVEDCLTGAVSSEPDQEIRLCVSIARSDLALAL
jgi:stearoyl-CoA 9-desaturase NADPH oxidoreductase